MWKCYAIQFVKWGERGRGRMVPVIVLKALLSSEPTFHVRHEFQETDAQYSAAEKDNWEERLPDLTPAYSILENPASGLGKQPMKPLEFLFGVTCKKQVTLVPISSPSLVPRVRSYFFSFESISDLLLKIMGDFRANIQSSRHVKANWTPAFDSRLHLAFVQMLCPPRPLFAQNPFQVFCLGFYERGLLFQ